MIYNGLGIPYLYMVLKMNPRYFRLMCLCLSFVLISCRPRGDTLPAQQELMVIGGENNGAEHPEMEQGVELPASVLDISVATVYRVSERMRVVNDGTGRTEKHNLWLALIQDVPLYQEVLSFQIAPGDYQMITDEYGNRYAEFDLSGLPPGEEVLIQADYEVKVNALDYDLGDCTGELPDFFTQPELYIESQNPQIIGLSEQLASDGSNACMDAVAFYNYIGDNLVYSYNGANWGAQAALGEMGADCTEYASLMIALSRAAGIPARYVEGLYYRTDPSEEIARTEHAWLEVYLPGLGWTPVDPTIGRTPLNREKYFAALPSNHIIVTRGRSPSTLRGGSYWTHLYWPGNATDIKVYDFEWALELVE